MFKYILYKLSWWKIIIYISIINNRFIWFLALFLVYNIIFSVVLYPEIECVGSDDGGKLSSDKETAKVTIKSAAEYGRLVSVGAGITGAGMIMK
jgi:hypothetical protein